MNECIKLQDQYQFCKMHIFWTAQFHKQSLSQFINFDSKNIIVTRAILFQKLQQSFNLYLMKNSGSGRWYALPRQNKLAPTKSKIASRMGLGKKTTQKPATFRDFEFNKGPQVHQIKFIPDQKTITDHNRYPEVLQAGFQLFKSLSDHQKITVEQKRLNRLKIKMKLNDKNNSQFQATARFETENENQDSKSDLNLQNSPLEKSMTNIHELSIGGRAMHKQNSIELSNQQSIDLPKEYSETTNINLPATTTQDTRVNSRQGMANPGSMQRARNGLQDRTNNAEAVVPDRDFSIATESNQSSALKNTRILSNRNNNRAERTQQNYIVRKVTIEEARSTPKDSDSPRGPESPGERAPAAQNGEAPVQYSKKNTIRRVSTLKNEDNHATALRKTKRALPEGDSDNAVEARKMRVKRGKTQKGDPGKAFPVETSENGINNLCKISESCLEELSIVESQDLYGSEAPDQRQREYDDRIQRRIQEGKQFLLDRQRHTQSRKTLPRDTKSQATDVNSRSLKKREHASERKATRKYQIIITKSNEPRNVLEMNKNQGNTQQNVFFKQLNRNNNRRGKAAGPPSDFISIGSSSDVRQSQLGNTLGRSQMERLSFNGRARREKRDSSSFFGSNYSSQSGANSIRKSQQNDILNKNKGRDAQGRTKAPPDVQPASTPLKPGSVPRTSDGLLSQGNSPLVPQNRKGKQAPGGSHPSSRGRVQSLTKQPSKTRPKLPGLRPLDSQKKKNVLSKELAQVTEKEEYEYSPMKSNVTHDNLTFDAMHKKELKGKNKEFQELDKELLLEKNANDTYEDSEQWQKRPPQIGDFYLKKVQSHDDTESQQFEDSLLEQSSPNADAKEMPYAHDQTSMNETTTNIQLCNASGSYRVQQVTLSSQDRKNAAELPKRKVSRRKNKRLQRSNHWKDGNFKNIKEYSMFIPNQPSVSQVQGKTKMYLAASEARDHPSVPKQSARRFAQQSDFANMMVARDRTSFRAQMCNSMTAGHTASRKLSPSDSKADRLNAKNPTTHVHRSVIQPNKTDGSLSEIENLTNRQDDRPTFKKMLTQKTDASKKNYTHSEHALKKQNTHHLARNEKYQNSYSKQQGKAERHERTMDQMISAQKEKGEDVSFPGQSFEQLNKYKKAKSQAKPKKVERSAFKNRASQSKCRLPSRTGEGWRPAILPPAEAEVDYLCNIAIIGHELEQENSLNDRKQEVQDQVSQQSHRMKFYPAKDQANQQNYSSMNSQSKLNRKSVDSLSNKNIKATNVVQDGNLYFQGALSVLNHGNQKQPFAQSAQKSDLPQVTKLTYSVPKRQKQKTVNYAGNAVLPGYLMPSIVNQSKPEKTPRGRNERSGWQVKKIVNHTQKPTNHGLLELLHGLANTTNHSRASQLDRHPAEFAEASPPTGGLLYYNDLFSGELRTRQKDTKYTPKIDGGRRRIGSYGQPSGFGDAPVRNKKSTDQKQQSQGAGSWQQAKPNYAPAGGETAQGAKFAQAMAKAANPPKSREASKGGTRQRPLQGDPYAIPLHYLRTGADPKQLTTKPHPRLAYKFMPKTIKGYAGSPFHASASNQISRSPDPLALRPQPVVRPIASNLESREGSRVGFGQKFIAGGDLSAGTSQVMPAMLGAGRIGGISSHALSNKKRRLRPIDSMEREKSAVLKSNAIVQDSQNTTQT